MFNRSYRELTTFAELLNRHNTVYRSFQSLSSQINNAAVSNRRLLHSIDSLLNGNVFYADTLLIKKEFRLLQNTVRDSVNIKITQQLHPLLQSELSWIYSSSIPDSIISQSAYRHIATYNTIQSLLAKGLERTKFLIDYRRLQLYKEISRAKIWMTVFVLMSIILLGYTTIGLFVQQNKRKRKEQELNVVLNRISDGVISVDNEWRYTFLNDAALVSYPQGLSKTLGKVMWEVHPEMKGTIFWDKYHEAMLTREVVEMETYYAPVDTWFSVKIYPSLDGLTIFFKNISEAKRAEEEMAKSMKEVNDYRYALDESSIVAVTNQKGIITYVNDNFCTISRYSKEELVGQDHRIVNSGFHSKEFIRNMWRTIARGNTWRGEMRNRAKDGTIYWVDTTIVPFLTEEHKPYQYVAIRADITDRKKTDEELKILNEELEKRVNERTAELTIANKELSQFAYVASHDLQEPLRTVSNYMQLFEEDYENILDENARKYIQSVKTATRRMTNLIKSLLNFSKLGYNKILTYTDCKKLVEDVIDDLKTSIKSSGAVITVDPLPVIYLYEAEIRQLFQNLISNAIKFKKPAVAPVIKITCEKLNTTWKFSIVDNGIGIDRVYFERVFDIFQRLKTNETYEGSGIGLANCKKIVQLHQGEIWIESTPGLGTTFFFTLSNYLK